jgi:alpha-ketoglutarate-dependent taurine dioxygenase
MSYTRSWPMKLWLCCVKAARVGGETPIADSRRIYARIPPAIRERFAERGVMYTRNYGHGVDLPWQEVFQTSDRTEVERQCREAGIELEWKSGDRLSTRQVCQGTARHPVTGASVWFNQAHLFHVSSLAADERDLLVQTLGEESLPRNAFYGDGSAIEPESFLEIRRAIAEETISFPWKEGDVLLVDNMLAAHGRNPYQGERKILVGMTELHGGSLPGLER